MTLTEAAFWTRRLGVLAIGGFAFFIIVVLIILVLPGNDPLPNYLTADFKCTPTAEEFKTHTLEIPSLQLASGSEPIYEINTQTGKLDQIPLMANVYKYSTLGASLSAQNDAKEIAKDLGFNPEEIERSATDYYWDEDEFGRSLKININTLNFKMETNFTNSAALPEEGSLPTTKEAESYATAFLRSHGWLFEDYSEEEPITVDINIEPDGSFSEAKSRSEAELIRVDFVRSKPFLSINGNREGATVIKTALEKEYLDYKSTTRVVNSAEGKFDKYEFKTEVFTLDTQKSNISVYIGPRDDRKETGDGNPNVYGTDYTGWVLDTEPCGTYPLISATQLATIIENGNGSLVYLNEKNGDDVVPYQPQRVSKFTVNQVRIAYLDMLDRQTFLQPVYLVSGEATLGTGITGTFYYYIPAIDYNNLQDPSPESLAPVVEEDPSPF
jgi:hypothetical protein